MPTHNLTMNIQPWLDEAYQIITKPLIQNRAHHALIIKYITGSGENSLINRLAMRLLCLHPLDNQPCGHCHSCQIFLAENHPDFYIIDLEKGKSAISVNQIRPIIAKIYERSQQGGRKVIWIKTASLMTEAAANALLKTLEEPPLESYFILSDQQNGQLLPTIRSRCQYYFLKVPELDNSVIWLKQQLKSNTYNDNELASAILLNENAPLAALALLNPEQWSVRQQFYTHLYSHLMDNDLWQLRDKLLNQDNLFSLLHWVKTLFADALKARLKSGRFIINRDQVPLVRLIASFGNDRIMQLYRLWDNTYQQLVTMSGLNQELIISNLLAQSEIILNRQAF